MPKMPDQNEKNYASLFADRQTMSVSELNGKIRNQLERDFGRIIVEGEISNFTIPASGHWYFSLKDTESQIKAVCFRQNNRLIRFRPRNGISVIVRGRLGLYVPRGEYQIQVETIEPVGAGALQLAFEQQVRRLEAEGLFEPSRKRKIPLLPRRVGIVTSPTGAAIRDILQILERRNRGLDVVVAPARVQGEGAAAEIAAAIRLLNLHAATPGQRLDVLIVGRGGGSKEDLWAFNEEVVARAIHDSAIPVISAVGHETDTTIADLVADVRAATPSAAAELVSAGVTDLAMRVDDLDGALRRAMEHLLLRRRSRWRNLIDSRAMTLMINRVQAERRRLDRLKVANEKGLATRLGKIRDSVHRAQLSLAGIDPRQPLSAAVTQLTLSEQMAEAAIHDLLTTYRQRLALAGGRLDMLSPLAVLGRGYTMTTDDRTRLITRALDVVPGQRVYVTFADGQIDCAVQSVILTKDGE
jgi:exodeoxyribonuclease VII large subunit